MYSVNIKSQPKKIIGNLSGDKLIFFVLLLEIEILFDDFYDIGWKIFFHLFMSSSFHANTCLSCYYNNSCSCDSIKWCQKIFKNTTKLNFMMHFFISIIFAIN